MTRKARAARALLGAILALAVGCGAQNGPTRTAGRGIAATGPESVEASSDESPTAHEVVGQRVVVGSSDHVAGGFLSELMALVLTEAGYEATIADSRAVNVGAPLEDIDRALDEDADEVDVWPEVFPDVAEWLASPLPSGGVVADRVALIDSELVRVHTGFVVNAAWAERLSVSSLDQIDSDESLWAQLDHDGDGRADVFGCPFGSACGLMLETQIAHADWDHIEITDTLVDDAAFDASYETFHELIGSQQPALAFMRSTSEHFARASVGIDTMWLGVDSSSVVTEPGLPGVDITVDLTQYDPVTTNLGTSGSNVDDCLTPSGLCQLGWLPSSIVVASRTTWLGQNPSAAALLSNITISEEELADAQLLLIGGVSAAEAARGWVEDHQAVVSEWIADRPPVAPIDGLWTGVLRRSAAPVWVELELTSDPDGALQGTLTRYALQTNGATQLIGDHLGRPTKLAGQRDRAGHIVLIETGPPDGQRCATRLNLSSNTDGTLRIGTWSFDPTDPDADPTTCIGSGTLKLRGPRAEASHDGS